VRWQFRGLSEEERRVHVYQRGGCEGSQVRHSGVVGTLAASRQIYGFGLQCKPEAIVDRWNEAQRHPIPPKIVENAPVHEIVYQGSSLMEKGGLGEFPIPISTPGYDCAPFTTASHGSREILKPASSISAIIAAM
jgi:4-hydroxy-3-polyprenylbenzoate decarboxylase